jgi:hypothetical protein
MERAEKRDHTVSRAQVGHLGLGESLDMMENQAELDFLDLPGRLEML